MRLETVVRHYLAALLWSETADSGEPLDTLADIDDITPAAVNTAEGDCESFIELARVDIAKLPSWYTAEQLGHDFLLTRNGHGAGFWDRGLGELGDILTAHAKGYESIRAYINDDFKIDTE